ncbi:MAG: Dynamin family protein [Deltaproteobacteria bacterium]|nr:MAG: Dynamin family protein [Deltaproteobacteria bacterium]
MLSIVFIDAISTRPPPKAGRRWGSPYNRPDRADDSSHKRSHGGRKPAVMQPLGTTETIAAAGDDFRQQRRRVLEGLEGARRLLQQDGAGAADAAGVLGELYRRLRSSRFHLAVLGQFKRGKSTLLNAFLGSKLLPSSVVPLTAVPTFIEYSPEPFLRVVGLDGSSEERSSLRFEQLRRKLDQLVTECGNPENRKRISRVDIGFPAGLLRDGVVLIDTPGVGSTYTHNTRTTLDFLPQCDAAVFVVSADPPLTEAELEFLQRVRQKAQQLFFVLNKIDYLDGPERDQARKFLGQVLRQRAGLEDVEIYCLSARQALHARQDGDEKGLQASGLPALERRLKAFIREEKEALLCRSIAARARDAVQQVLFNKRLELQGLELPLEQLEQKLASFDEQMEVIRNRRQQLADRLAGEQQRCREFIEQRAGELRRRARRQLESLLAEHLEDSSGCPSEEHLRRQFAAAVPELFQGELVALAGRVAAHVEQRLGGFEQEVGQLVERVRQSAAAIFAIDYRAPESRSAFCMQTSVYWESYRWSPSFSPLPVGALDGLLPARQRRARLQRRWHRQITALVRQNTETTRWQLLQSLIKAFAHFAGELDGSLEHTIENTRRAVAAAAELRNRHADANRQRLAGLRQLIAGLETWLETGSSSG